MTEEQEPGLKLILQEIPTMHVTETIKNTLKAFAVIENENISERLFDLLTALDTDMEAGYEPSSKVDEAVTALDEACIEVSTQDNDDDDDLDDDDLDFDEEDEL